MTKTPNESGRRWGKGRRFRLGGFGCVGCRGLPDTCEPNSKCEKEVGYHDRDENGVGPGVLPTTDVTRHSYLLSLFSFSPCLMYL